MVQELRFVLVEMPACREGMKYSFVKGDSGDNSSWLFWRNCNGGNDGDADDDDSNHGHDGR